MAKIRILPVTDMSFGKLEWQSEGFYFQSNPYDATQGTDEVILNFHYRDTDNFISNGCSFDVILSVNDENLKKASIPFSMVIPAKAVNYSYASLTIPSDGYYRLRPVMVQVTPHCCSRLKNTSRRAA